MAFTFQKSERLCSKYIIEQLFVKGNRGFSQFPFRFSWTPAKLDSSSPIQVLITVSKRNFPKANQRNQIKRLVRELYRLNKHVLYDVVSKKETQYALMISYIAKEKILHQELSKIFHQSLLKLLIEFEKTDSSTVYPSDQVL
jgi:ribonuclease P protein component